MKSVCVDNHILIWGIREYAEPGQAEMIPRTKAFFEDCKKSSIKIMVPALVLAELLTAVDPRMHAMIHNLIRSSFQVPPFDSEKHFSAFRELQVFPQDLSVVVVPV